ncbi:MAG: glycosyltransferase family 4 protein [Candidatus Omnitrophota bacterium]
MKILYLTNHLNTGGITSYILTLACGMKKRGHDVYIASSKGDLLYRFIENGIEYLPIPIRTKSEASYKILLSRFKLSGYLKDKKIDIIHANTRVTQVLSCMLGRPYISTCHGFFKKRLLRKIFPSWGRKVIAISQPVKEHLIRDLWVREDDIAVIHNGIDVEKFAVTSLESRVNAKRRLGLGDGPVVGIVARLSEEKGHAYLIEAMQGVIARIPAVQLFIVGEGRTKEGLAGLARDVGLDKSVVFLPTVMDTREALSAMDLFVLPSTKEGLGLALMEAMACGIAVIGSDAGGIKSLIRDKDNGLLVAAADSRGLSRAILELLQNTGEARRLGGNAAAFIKGNFSQEKMARETEEVYLECLNADS